MEALLPVLIHIFERYFEYGILVLWEKDVRITPFNTARALGSCRSADCKIAIQEL